MLPLLAVLGGTRYCNQYGTWESDQGAKNSGKNHTERSSQTEAFALQIRSTSTRADVQNDKIYVSKWDSNKTYSHGPWDIYPINSFRILYTNMTLQRLRRAACTCFFSVGEWVGNVDPKRETAREVW